MSAPADDAPLKLAGFDVRGVSIAGIETCIELPGLDLAFDIGRCPTSAVARSRLLISHPHMDHVGGIVYHANLRNLQSMKRATYYVPRECADEVRALFDCFERLDGNPLGPDLVPIGPGDEADLGHDRVVRPLRAAHRIHSQGYAIWSRRRKLLPEYRGRSSREIAALRRDGVDVTELREVPEVVYTGDTRAEMIDREPVLRRARLLIIEVSFLDERVSVKRSRQGGHLHLDELIERADLFENEAILVTHVSARYARDEIVSILDARLPPNLRGRVTPLLAGH